MALMKISGTDLTVTFSGWERMWLKRDKVTVPLAALRRVDPVRDPLREAHGTRSGIQVSGFAKVGTWGLVKGPRQLVAAYRGSPGLHVLLDRAAASADFDELVLSVDEADQLAEQLTHHLGRGR
ncbi:MULTISPECIES: hypothetical protein [Streptomyces]|uniref:Bacterial Pleckstrin homology domain-containing protein n=1 Tax=Streptomyces odorifer TaxID=53450 RepID=A0A7Y6KID7_9ACTN|nr:MULTISPECIES: hypothetical protein [Streptomyces]NUV34590.1 hypothetical protein [Streptomyces sp. KAI-27]NUV46714.1 hypothetical protein [Streptomyces sp. CAI-78]KLI99841.1 hypothetical protein WQ59_16930 [Streptomyces sp. KE1]MBL0778257.1 hypothetical protein [Streptomyces albidoflavus]MBL0801581.1 hypothetical protein [Streptomyces albidoflavus]